MKYRLAVFDMDGTILDTLEDLADSVNYALNANGFKSRSLDEVRGFVGNGIHKLIERAVPLGTACEDVEKVFGLFCEYYKDHCSVKTKPYEGINECLCQLKEAGCLTAVVSNKADFGVQALCEEFYKGLFDFAAGENAMRLRKPDPCMVIEALRTLGVDKDEAVYIGDSDVDIATAANSGLDCICVTWGFRDKDFLIAHGGEVFADSPRELSGMILG